MAPLKVICPGISRTGTESLRTALNMLGYNTMHFLSFITDYDMDINGFQNAIDNREETDWDKLYENYDAITDIPTFIWYKDLMKKYPDAKVILTVRDSESWYTSATNLFTIIHDREKQAKTEISMRALKLLDSLGRSSNILHPEFLENKEAAIAAFEQHNREVMEYVPQEKLYVMKLGEGWEGICKFLDKSIPNTPYPRGNSPTQLHETLKKIEKKNIELLSVGKPDTLGNYPRFFLGLVFFFIITWLESALIG